MGGDLVVTVLSYLDEKHGKKRSSSFVHVKDNIFFRLVVATLLTRFRFRARQSMGAAPAT